MNNAKAETGYSRTFNRTEAPLTGTFGSASNATTKSFGNGYFIRMTGAGVAPSVSGSEWFSKSVSVTDTYLYNDGENINNAAINGLNSLNLSFKRDGTYDMTIQVTYYCSYFVLNDSTYAETVGCYSTKTLVITDNDIHSLAVTPADDGMADMATSRFFAVKLSFTVADSAEESLLVNSLDINFACDSAVTVNPTGFYLSQCIDSVYYHTITTVDEFRNIPQYVGYGQGSSSTYYLIANDLDFGGESPWNTSTLQTLISSYTFVGHLDGGTYASSNLVYNSVAPTSVVSLKNLSSTWINESYSATDAVGLFDQVGISSFSSFNIENFDIGSETANTGKPAAFIACRTTATQDAEVSFNYINVDSASSITATGGVGALLGYGRSSKVLTFNHCESAATIKCSSNNVGGFLGSASTCTDLSLTINDCAVSGSITALNYVSGMAAALANQNNASSNQQHYTFSNNVVSAEIKAEQGVAGKVYMGPISATIGVANYVPTGTVTYTNNTFTGHLTHSSLLTVPSASTDYAVPFELGPVGTSASLINVATDYTKADFVNDVTIYSDIEVLDITFNGNLINVSASTAGATSYKLTVGITHHNVRVDGSWIADGYKTVQTETVTAVANLTTRKLLKAGYFIPSGYAKGISEAPYYYNFDMFLMDDSHLGESGYEDGWHQNATDGAYVIFTNPDLTTLPYVAIVKQGTSVQYLVSAYNSANVLVGQGVYVDEKASDTNLVAYSG